MNLRTLATALFLSPLLVLAPKTLSAQEGPSEEVLEVIRDMAELLDSAENMTFEADVLFDEILPSGLRIQRSANIMAAAAKPNHLAARFDGGERDRGLWYNDGEATLLHETAGIYSTVEVPEGIRPALDHLMEKYDISLPLADFVIDDVFGSLTERIENATYVGKATINGHECEHIACSQEFIDWQLWVDDGLVPVPRRVVITYKAVPGVPSYMATFTDWDFEAELPESVFRPDIPDDAVKIDLLEIDRSEITAN